jgi:hypothetical protein
MTMTTALAPGVGVEVTPSTWPGAPAGSDGLPGQLRVGRRRHRAASPRSVLRARPRERCQFENSFYVRDWPYNLARGARHAVLLFLRHAERPVAQGRPSSYQVGDWVRVKDAGAVRATLDSRDCLRGLRFTAVQSAYCGRTYRVERALRRILDDSGRPRSISGTVALAGTVCDGPDGSTGCGWSCSLSFRDEWLEPSSAALAEAPRQLPAARVKPLAEIEATLDRRRRPDGISFQAGMAEHAGKRYPVLRRVEEHGGLPRWKRQRGEWYVLDGVRCRGLPLGAEGACDRSCGLLWITQERSQDGLPDGVAWCLCRSRRRRRAVRPLLDVVALSRGLTAKPVGPGRHRGRDALR